MNAAIDHALCVSLLSLLFSQVIWETLTWFPTSFWQYVFGQEQQPVQLSL